MLWVLIRSAIYFHVEMYFLFEKTAFSGAIKLGKELTLFLQNKDATPTSNSQPVRLLDPDCCYKFYILNGKQCRSRSVG